MTVRMGTPRVLHVFGSVAKTNPQALRALRLANAFGGRLRHTVVADDGDWHALEDVEKGVAIEREASFPRLAGIPTPGRLQAIARAMLDYHLVLTYGLTGARVALAHTTFSEVHSLPPLIHHEDGSDETDVERRGLRSKWARRVGLGKAAGLVVPSETMEGAALEHWQQPLGRVKLIRDGIDLGTPAKKVRDALPRLRKQAGERWMVSFPSPEGCDDLAAILRSLALLDPHWHLVASVEGEARRHALAEAARHGVDNRFHPVSPTAKRGTLLALADLVVLAGGREPVPLAALEAMGAGLAVVGFASGDVVSEIGPENGPYLSRPGDAEGLRAHLERLVGDDYLRKSIGAANRERAVETRDQKAMISSYRRLYASAMGRSEL